MIKSNTITKGIIHFIGIGGIGMSGIAELMLDQGYSIQCSDVSFNSNIKRLREKGVRVFLNHNKSNTIQIYDYTVSHKNHLLNIFKLLLNVNLMIHLVNKLNIIFEVKILI